MAMVNVVLEQAVWVDT